MARRNQTTQTLAAAAVAAAALGFIAGRATAPAGGTAAGPEKVAPAAAAPKGDAAKYEETYETFEVSPYKGPADAPVVIYEVSEFQCPFCSRVTPTMQQVVDTYPNDVKLVFRHNPLDFHKEARLASIASMAAARQGRFWAYHDELFANQKALQKDKLLEYAKAMGLDMEQFKKDLDDPKIARKVDNDQAASVALGATGTPAFFVNGVKLSGAKPFEEFKAEIDGQLAKAKALEDQGVARADISRRLTAQSGASATTFIKYFVDEVPAPKVAKKQAPKKKQEDTKTVWKVPVDAEAEHVKGPKHALVTIAEFSEFQCPFCAKVLPTYKQIMDTYGDKVRVVYKHNPLPFHADAPLASQAALAAGAQGKFWEYHDKLYEVGTKALSRPELETYATELGLDLEAFNKDLDEGTFKAKISDDQALAEAVQAKGTPNHFVNGRKLTGAKPFEEFKAIIDEEIKKAEAKLAAGTPLDKLYDVLIAGGKVFNPLDPKAQAITIGAAHTKGDKNARIQIVEWSDFECPFCSRVGGPLKQLVSKYPGEVVVAFKHFPLSFHKNAQKASEAALAAGAQGQFWAMHDLMFDNQKALTIGDLTTYAEQIGLDMDLFSKDLSSGKYAGQVKADMAEGTRFGVRGTPSVYINGRKYSPSSGYALESLEKLLAKEFGLKVKE